MKSVKSTYVWILDYNSKFFLLMIQCAKISIWHHQLGKEYSEGVKLVYRYHRQLLPQIRFLKSFLDTNYSFRVLALRSGFTGPVLRQESPGALGIWVSSLFVELYTSCCWEQSSSSSPGNIFLSLRLKFRFGLVWWHELGSESPVLRVNNGPLSG